MDNGKRQRRSVAVVVGSGGIKTLAAAEVFRALESWGIPVDLLIGCSGGAIMTALRGAGYSPDAIHEHVARFWVRDLFSRLDFRTILSILPVPLFKYRAHSALMRPDPILRVLRQFFGPQRLEDLRPETILQATDADTGEGVVLSRGLLADAVYVSGAQFPFLPPLELDGHWLVDGGFSSSLPIMEAVRRGIDVIIALCVEQQQTRFQTFLDYCLHFFSRNKTISERFQTALALDMHHHEIIVVDVRFPKLINMWDVHEIPAILAAGREAMAGKQDEIRRALAVNG